MQHSGNTQTGNTDLQFLLERALSDYRGTDTDISAVPLMGAEIAAALNADAVRIQLLDGQTSRCLYCSDPEYGGLADPVELQEVLSSSTVVTRRPQSGPGTTELCIAVVDCAGTSRMSLEIAAAETLPDEWLSAAAEILAELYRRELTDRLLQLQTLQHKRDSAVLAIHRAPDRISRLHTLVESASAVQHCRRLAVCERTAAGAWKLICLTGVRDFSDRAEAVRTLEQTAAGACLRSTTVEPGPPAQDNSEPVHRDCVAVAVPSASQPRTLALPLNSLRLKDCSAVLLAEFSAVHGDTPQSLRLLADHFTLAAAATAGARKAGSNRGRRRLHAVASILAAIGFLLLLTLLPADLTIEARGTLLPAAQMHVYAPEAGIITLVNADDADAVQNGQQIAELQCDELQLQLESVLGSLSAAEARLASLQSRRIARGDNNETLQQAMGDVAETTALVNGLRQQRQLLDQRLQRLQINAPASGTLIADDFRERFEGRPVERGQHLCRIAVTDGPWQLELEVNEADIGYLLAALHSGQAPPSVRFSADTDPAATATTTVSEVAAATSLNKSGQLVTRVTAGLQQVPEHTQRLGSGVSARIHCGRYPLGRVWFRQILDFISRNIFG